MTTGSRPGWNAGMLTSLASQRDAAGRLDSGSNSREVDERTAIYLLSLARELLRHDHSAIAGMIDYAIAEIETKNDMDD